MTGLALSLSSTPTPFSLLLSPTCGTRRSDSSSTSVYTREKGGPRREGQEALPTSPSGGAGAPRTGCRYGGAGAPRPASLSAGPSAPPSPNALAPSRSSAALRRPSPLPRSRAEQSRDGSRRNERRIEAAQTKFGERSISSSPPKRRRRSSWVGLGSRAGSCSGRQRPPRRVASPR
jgi:hypothetical protein